MSHIAQVQVVIKDLDALKAACAAVGLEFREGQKTYRWFGRVIGDFPLPEGFAPSELGKCEHALSVPHKAGQVTIPYEIGVVKRKDGKGWMLLWDFWQGGFGLQDVVGPDCCKLKQQYTTHAALRQMRREGYRVKQQVGEDGKIRLTCTK